MTKLDKITISSICLIGALCATTALAVDQAAAAGALATISSLSVQSKANLSEVALGGDVDAIAEAKKRSDAIDGAVAQATAAYAALESAVASGNEDAAQSAFDELKVELENAMDALEGVIPQDVMDAAAELKGSRSNSGGGPGLPYDAVNVYDVLWSSSTMRDFYQNEFANFFESGWCPVDKEATPE